LHAKVNNNETDKNVAGLVRPQAVRQRNRMVPVGCQEFDEFASLVGVNLANGGSTIDAKQ
jgi:hypothetical protein